MKKSKITFWKEPYNSEDAFVKDLNSYLTTAEVTKASINSIDTYHLKLCDIGLDSRYDEFDIIRKGFWQTSTEDTMELNFLKWNIICELDRLIILG